MSDFSLSKGSKKDGVKALITSIIIFIVVPIIGMIVLNYVKDLIVSGMPVDMSRDELDAIFNMVSDILILYLILGIPAIIFRTLGGFYPAGNRARLTFMILYGIYIAVFIIMVTSGGIIQTDLSSIVASMLGNDYNYHVYGLKVVIDISGLVMIIVLITLFKNIVPIGEYMGARKEYLEKEGQETA